MCVIVYETCAAIIKVLQSKYIKFPTGNDLQSDIDGFNMKWDMMHCAVAIDGCHIPVNSPSLNHTDFYIQSKRLVFYYFAGHSGP